ncbi:MAG: isoprenylcysteine carboxylmethyltransferase family protein [Pseudomonadota bacterium]
MHRKRLALVYGFACHSIFAAAVGAMIVMMYFGMSRTFGGVPYPYAWGVNLLLVLQFPLAHSFFLTGPGMKILARLAPDGHGKTLATTTYAIIASLQLLLLFTLWTPTGTIWWQAEGAAFWGLTALYGLSWLLLLKASFDAGAEVQSGLLGWSSLLRGVKPLFPDMPTGGLFRLVRQPIYVSFALTLWTVPVWTPDQLMLATVLTLYCLLGPLLKERRFERMFGARFEAYRARVPYWLPLPRSTRRRSERARS